MNSLKKKQRIDFFLPADVVVGLSRVGKKKYESRNALIIVAILEYLQRNGTIT